MFEEQIKNTLVPISLSVSTPSPEEIRLGTTIKTDVGDARSLDAPLNQKELGYIRIEELLSAEKLSIELAEGMMLRIASGEIEQVLNELKIL